jgi:subtilisin family serine protease
MRTRKAKAKAPNVVVKKKKESSIPEIIYAQASPRSAGGVSLFEGQERIKAETVANFLSEAEVITRAVNRLRDAGFDILQVTSLTINIAGPASIYEQAFNTKIIAEERPVIKEEAKEDTATFLDSPDTEISGLISTAGTTFSEVIEGVAIEEPRYFMGPSVFPPLKPYWHLDVPSGISLGCNADRVHRSGITGKGIKIAMVDSGWFKHPFFVNRGYRAAPVVLGPAAVNPLADESGHGTGESANIFAVAPDVQLLPVKINFVNSIGAFNAAVGLSPHIITCSWGSDTATTTSLSAADQALAAAIAAAVAGGITVVFSAGNGHVGFPGQHPDVISAGGVFMDADESLKASNYASGFSSVIYPNRPVPDVSGLVGMRPRAMYIMLPLEPGDNIDDDNSGGTHPSGDQTANNDGWAAFSGTSAAAPQLAGAVALVKQACPGLTPSQIRNILMKTARDVTSGTCNGTALSPAGNPAGPGPDLATGTGLVDAHKAVLSAKIQCLGPIQPVQALQALQPLQPVQPLQPLQPVQPISPEVLLPSIGGSRLEAAPPTGELQSAGRALSEEDVQALQELITKSELDLGIE